MSKSKSKGLPLLAQLVLVLALFSPQVVHSQTLFDGQLSSGVQRFQSYTPPAEGAVSGTEPGAINEHLGLPVQLDLALGFGLGVKGMRLLNRLNYVHAAAMNVSPKAPSGSYQKMAIASGIRYNIANSWRPRLGLDLGWRRSTFGMASATHSIAAFLPQVYASVAPFTSTRFAISAGMGVSTSLEASSGGNRQDLTGSASSLTDISAEVLTRVGKRAHLIFGFDWETVDLQIPTSAAYQSLGLTPVGPTSMVHQVRLQSQSFRIGARRRW